MTYSSSLALSRQRYSQANTRSSGTSGWGRNRNDVSFSAKERNLGPISNIILLTVLACLLGLLYLTQVTKTNAYSYKINSLNQKQTTLEQQHNDLEIASARLQSLDRVQNSTVAKKLVSVAPNGTAAE